MRSKAFYNNEDFFKILCKFDRDVCIHIMNLVKKALSPDKFIDALESLNIKYKLSVMNDEDIYLITNASFKYFLTEIILNDIFDNNCNGSYRYNASKKEGIFVLPNSHCDNLSGHLITKILGERGSSRKLFDKYRDVCRIYGSIYVELDNKTNLQLKCSNLPDIKYKIELDI